MALIFTAYILPMNLIDNVLRPITFTRSLKTPMPVIIVGIMGGTLSNVLIASLSGQSRWRSVGICRLVSCKSWPQFIGLRCRLLGPCSQDHAISR
jgi:hypothetical protein